MIYTVQYIQKSIFGWNITTEKVDVDLWDGVVILENNDYWIVLDTINKSIVSKWFTVDRLISVVQKQG